MGGAGIYIIFFALKTFPILHGNVHLNKVLNRTELRINEFLSLALIIYQQASLLYCLICY